MSQKPERFGVDAARPPDGPYFIVMNQASGSEAANSLVDRIGKILNDAGREHEFFLMDSNSDFEQIARNAVAKAMDAKGVVVAAGGDGTINLICQCVLESGVPMGVLPMGTFNYFARAHNISEDVEQATTDLLSSPMQRIPVAQVNNRVFLVNASLGLYPKLLEDREIFKQQLGRSRIVAMIAGIWSLLRHIRRLRLEIESESQRRSMKTASLIVLSNALQMEELGLEEGDSPRELTAVMLKAVGNLRLLGLALRGAFGQLGNAEDIVRLRFHDLKVTPGRRRRVKVALDGESLYLDTPLRFGVAREPLQLLMPAPTPADTSGS